MIITQDVLEAYKKAIRVKFEEEKTNEYSSFLVVPSRAKLRQLCVERFKNNENSDDLKSFEIFFGFEFGNKNKLQDATDKFRPIETFLKGETDLADIEGINIAAVLVNFQPRPFKKFAKLHSEHLPKKVLETRTTESKSNHLAKKEDKSVLEKEDIVVVSRRNLKRKVGIGSLIVLGIFGSKSVFFKEKECMEWKEDHYELIDCKSQQDQLLTTKIIKAYNKIEFERKELIVCDTTTFFKDHKPKVWYSKKNNVIQFFNMDGENPENGAEIKKITPYMIDKYVKPCE